MKRFIVFLVFLSCFSLAQAADYSRFIGSRVLFGESTTPPACFYGDSQQKVTAEYWQKNIAGHEAEIRQNRQGYLDARLDSGVSLMFPRGMGEEGEIAAFGIQKIIPAPSAFELKYLSGGQWYAPVIKRAIGEGRVSVSETYTIGLKIKVSATPSETFIALRDVLEFYSIGLSQVKKNNGDYEVQTAWIMKSQGDHADTTMFGEPILPYAFLQDIYEINPSELNKTDMRLLYSKREYDLKITAGEMNPQSFQELSPWLARLIIRLDHPTDWQEILMRPENNP